MSLGPGTRLGPYEIKSALGAGGMGEVYRATDTTLGRQVAIKVLPEAFAGNAERLARFEREAKTLAALNHPNIAQIYGVDRSGESPALVLELVEGDTLADQIGRGPIALDEALPIVKQIAEALEVAHAHGVIHRDLKPANIKIRPDGTVKVLDFGLAKLSESAGSGQQSAIGASLSPTITSPALMTGVGVILGTAAYMSPEQAKGREADKRSDVWAFGCIFYEMLTGRRPFDGEDVSDTFANVLKIDPDWTKLPRDLPPTIVTLIKGCLEKNRAQRISDVAVVRFLLNQPAVASTPGAAAAPPSAASRLQSQLGWSVAALALVALAAMSWVHLREQPQVGPLVHLTVPLPEIPPGFVALSPDGRTLATTLQGAGLRLYSLDSGEARNLTGTLVARTPFWSPDSRTIAFFAEGMLKTVPASGGPPQRLCGDTGLGGGGTWSRSGVILFATDSGALRRVAAGGGECTDVVRVPGEQRARLPVFLPDGDHFLYARREGIGTPEVYVASLEEPNGRRLLPDFSSAEFVPDRPGSNTGHMLFVREQTLMAQRFDAASLELSGEPVAIASQVGASATPPQIAASASTNGTIVYLANGRPDRQLVWYDHSGKEISRGAAAGSGASAASLAPTGRWLAYLRTDAQFAIEARLVDLERQQETRLFAPPVAPPVVWSPDAVRLAFRSIVMGTAGIYLRNLNGGTEELLLREEKNTRVPSHWTRDNRWILYTELTEQTRGDIWMVPGPGRGFDAKPVPLLQTPANESQGQVSPDGRWIAYSSDETGSDQVYIRPFAERDLSRDPAWPVPTAGGREPRWRADGKELFYLVRVPGTSRFSLMSVPVSATDNPLGEAKALFEIPVGLTVSQNNNWTYAPSPDGQRFAFVALAGDARPSLEVLLNWAANQPR